jgi:methylmalonyl-CoA mutase cobalamin-binding subunit
MSRGPRIALIHALRESQVPAWTAFAEGWPEAEIFNILDDSLSTDFASAGHLTDAMVERFLTLGRYVAGTDKDSRRTEAILFTCSAFGAAIDKVKRDLPIPVLRPNEAAFEAALDVGSRIALMSTFSSSLPPLVDELRQMAKERGVSPEITTVVAAGGLEALKAGDGALHDRIAARAAAELQRVDVLVLCQFSLARAASVIAPVPGRTVLTTPGSAVAKLRRLLS